MLRIGLTAGWLTARRMGTSPYRRFVRHFNLNNYNYNNQVTFAFSFRALSTCSISDSNATATTSNILDAETVTEAYGADAPKYGAMEDSSMSEAYSAIELALDSVVKIFTVSSSPSYFLPWQNKSQRETMGSGLSFFPYCYQLIFIVWEFFFSSFYVFHGSFRVSFLLVN